MNQLLKSTLSIYELETIIETKIETGAFCGYKFLPINFTGTRQRIRKNSITYKESSNKVKIVPSNQMGNSTRWVNISASKYDG